jgi:MFS family permease
MTDVDEPASSSPRTDRDGVDRQRRAVFVLFFVNGASFSSWLPRVPEVRDRLDLSLSGLGLVLVGLGLGGLASSAIAGAVVDRVGSRRAAVGASLSLTAGLPLIGWAPTAVWLAVALTALATVDALADVGMNVQAAEVQRRTARSVIQRFHASWSIGTVGGAASGTAAAAGGLPLTVQLLATGAVLATAVVVAASGLAPETMRAEEHPQGAGRARALVLTAVLACAIAVVEGTSGDWAAVYAADVHGASKGVAGLGYVAVASGMVLGRLLGDHATDRMGAQRLFSRALVTVGVGLAAVVASPTVVVAVVGFVVMGLGVSVVFPALYLRAASTPGVPAGFGVGVMSTGARLGFLVSPPVTGAVADASSLRLAVAVVIGAAALLAQLLGTVLGRLAPVSGGPSAR